MKKKTIFVGLIVGLILAVVLLQIISCFVSPIEHYSSNDEIHDIEYYVIHHRPNKEREFNVNEQQQKLGKHIHIFDAIMGKDLDMNHLQQFDERLQPNYKIQTSNVENVHGCYLSHFMLIKQLMDSGKQDGYTVIFEDDVNILDVHLDKSLQHILSIIQTDFDILYLGNLSENHGVNYAENVYEFDTSGFLYGTHGYLVNNKHLSNIYESLLNLNEAIDYKYYNAIVSNELKSLVIYPVLVEQNGSPSILKT